MIKNRLAAALAIALFLVLAGTGAGHALWSSQASTTASVAAGAIGVTQDGFSSLGQTYSPTELVRTAPITVTNTGTITAPFTLTLGAALPSGVALAVLVNTWPVASAGACDAGSSVPAAATSGNWTTVPALTGTLAPAASAVYCVRTSITAAQAVSQGGGSVVPTLSLTSTVGTWSASVSASTSQQIVDTTAPTAPGTPIATSTTPTQTTLVWTASTDNAGVESYDVYRDGVLGATVTSTTHTDTGLTAGTGYSYTITARDAAGNVSAPSGAGIVTQPLVSSGARYRITNPDSAMCLGGLGNGTANGTALVTWGCSGDSTQNWQFVSTGDGYYRVYAQYDSNLVWNVAGGYGAAGRLDGAAINLWASSAHVSRQWQIVSTGIDTYHFVNRNSGKCLDVTGSAMTAGTQLQQWSCGTSVSQTFTLTEVG